MVSPPQGVDIKEQLREIVQTEITSGTKGTSSILKEEIRDVVQKEITSGTPGTPSIIKEELREMVRGELTSGDVNAVSLFRDEVRKELTSGSAAKKTLIDIIREELTSGSAGSGTLLRVVLEEELRAELTSGVKTEKSPLYQDLVKSVTDEAATSDAAIFVDSAGAAADYTVPHDCILRLIGAVSADAVLSYVLTRTKGTTTVTKTIKINGGSVLKADIAYEFDIPFTKDDSVNLQVNFTGSCTIQHLEVYKIRQAAP